MPEKKNNSQEYWNKRARQDKIKVIKTAEYGVDNLKKLLKKNLDSVEKQIKDFYKKYGDEGKYAEQLSYAEFQKYKAKLRLKAKQNPQDKTLQRLAKQDIPKYRIDRLRALQTDLQIQLTEATRGQEAGIYKTLKDVAKVSQATTALRFKRTLDVAFDKIASRKLEKILSSDWVGNMNWSERLWKDRELVGKKVTEILETGLPQGKSMQDMARDLKEATNSSFNDAFRLIRTEAAHVDGEVLLESFKQAQRELGYEYYIYDAFLDSRTSKICRELNGKRFKISEAQIGVNWIPAHINCRSTCTLDESSINEDLIENEKSEQQKINENTTNDDMAKILSKQDNKDIINSIESRYDDLNKNKNNLENEFTSIREFIQKAEANNYAWVDNAEKAEMFNLNARRHNAILAELKQIENQKVDLVLNALSINAKKDVVFGSVSKTLKAQGTQLKKDLSKLLPETIMPEAKLNIDLIKKTKKDKREYFTAFENKIFLKSQSKRTTAIHEAMHWLEHHNKDIANKSQKFLIYRTQNESAVKLKDLIPNSKYEDYEIAKKDNFFSPYCGRIYEVKGQLFATEVLSMGVEELLKNPIEFYKKDKEYANFVISVLRGKI